MEIELFPFMIWDKVFLEIFSLEAISLMVMDNGER